MGQVFIYFLFPNRQGLGNINGIQLLLLKQIDNGLTDCGHDFLKSVIFNYFFGARKFIGVVISLASDQVKTTGNNISLISEPE